MKNFKFRTFVGLIMVFLAIFMNWQWMWGILFLVWVLPDLFTGVTYFMDAVERRENPILFWLVMLVWIGSSAYMLLDGLAPQFLPQGWSSESYSQMYETEQDGSYGFDAKAHENEPTTLKYKSFATDEFNLVGISAVTTHNNYESAQTLEELWAYFVKEDISQAIPDIIDDKVYLIYSDYDKEKKDHFRVTIGYKTATLDNIYEGLTAVKVAASNYAVFEIDKNVEKNIGLTWEKIELSDLKRSKTNDLEIYHYSARTQSFYKADLLVSVPTSKTDLAKIKEQPKPKASTNNPKPKVTVIKDDKPYTPAPPTVSSTSDNANTAYTEEEIKEMEQKYPTKPFPSLHLVGIQATANPNNQKDMEIKTNKLWDDFLKKDYSKSIKNIQSYEKVYVTYTNYSDKSVTITLGYRTKSKGEFKAGKNLKAVSIPKNDYYSFQLSENKADYQGEEWDALYQALEYRDAKSSDIEIYTFDNSYNIIDAWMWVAAK